MRKRLASILLVGAGAAAAITLVASSASAAGTWSISPGGKYTASLTSGTTAVLTDSAAKATVTCTASTTNGTLQTGTGLNNPLGTISTTKWTSCTGPDGSTGTAAGNNASTAWSLNGVSYSSGVTTGSITSTGTGVGGTISLSSILGACTIVVGGTSAKPASASGTYTNSTGVLAITGTTNLVVTSVSGVCPGVATGQSTTFTASYTVSPKQTVTSP
jgi:hypothetical protein